LSDKEEGFQVANEIFRLANYEQQDYSDFAVLYRTNAQSRILEEALRKRNIPYKIHGGQSFYQRKEIKDLLAYFRLTVNPDDEEAFRRIINYPRRGIGDSTVERIREIAAHNQVSMWVVLCNLDKVTDSFNAGTIAKLQKFGNMIAHFKELIAQENAYDAAGIIARSSGIIDDLATDDTPEGVSRKENIQELLNAIKEFCETAYQEGRDDKLPAFLEGVALLTDQDTEKEGDWNKVTLMTIHAAKGLEFANVFITGMEEELFPAQQCTSVPSALEEERRLFYVALTRAEKRAFLSYSTSRYKNGQIMYPRPSRFIDEIEPEFLDGYIPLRNAPSTFKLKNMPPAGNVKRNPVPLNAATKPDIPELDRSRLQPIDANQVVPDMIIFHPTFGTGKVISIEGLGVQKKAKVLFKEGESRILLLKFAKLFAQPD
ncbi:MAG: ATP-binding domain-containing protein, partial [Odoribacter sp.]|nr:ATP-binding domain-containing protein [Odoribacter sp.]